MDAKSIRDGDVNHIGVKNNHVIAGAVVVDVVYRPRRRVHVSFG